MHQIKSDNEKRLELVIEAAAVGVWDWEVQTGEVAFNKRWAEISGYTPEELTPMTFEIWKDGVHPDDGPMVLERIEKHLDGTLDFFSAELRIRHKDGGYVWALASGRVVEWDSGGRPIRMLSAYFDITERKASEHELIVASQLLQETQAISNVGGWELISTGRMKPTAFMTLPQMNLIQLLMLG